MKANSRISIDRVHGKDMDSLLTLYVDLFYDREPLTKAIGFSKERMISIARSMYAESDINKSSQGLYWIARDRAAADRGVGFIVCDDPAAVAGQQLPDNLTDSEIKKVSAVSSLLEEIRNPIKEPLGLGKGINLHVSAVGVAPGYEGKGIAGNLLQTALANSCDFGFKYAFSECTSIASRMLHEKCGFENLKSVSINTYVLNGRRPFKGCNFDIHLMWKILNKGKSSES